MGCRGVKKSHATMTTSAMRGVFFDKAEARAELMELIKNQNGNREKLSGSRNF